MDRFINTTKLCAAILIALFLYSTSAAFAGECEVTGTGDGTGEGSLRWAVSKSVDGGCVTEDIRYRDKYSTFYPSSIRFHVIRFKRSVDIYMEDSLTIDSGTDDDPILIIADEEAAVRLRGESSSSSAGLIIKGSRVIVDHMTLQGFGGAGLKIAGDDNLIVRSRILSNSEDGVVITGRENRIVDSDVAANGFNGIVIGEGSVSTNCSNATVSSTGSDTSLFAVSVRDNGANVIGKDCNDSSDAAPSACAMIEMHLNRCMDMVRGEPPCEKPSSIVEGDSCSDFWREMARCTNFLDRASITQDDSAEDAKTKFFDLYPGANGGFGVLTNATGVKFDGWRENERGDVMYGVAEPLEAGRYSGSVRDNRSYGVYVNELTPEWLCRDFEASDTVDLLIGARISETTFESNAQDVGVELDNGIFIGGPTPPRIEHVAAVGDLQTSQYVVTGSVLPEDDSSSPWSDRNFNTQAIRVEVYLAPPKGNEGMYFMAAQEGVAQGTGNFSISFARPIKIDGVEVSSPSFVVTYVDVENGVTAPFSIATGTTSEDDSDGDGLSNSQEDIDGDGIVGPGESDPANIDTDGDGLTDGEEKLHTGRLAALIASNVVFENLNVLDPANPDSDGDCLPDGLEVGVTEVVAKALLERMRRRPRYVLSSACRAILGKATKVLNVIPYDDAAPNSLDNIAIMYDVDGETVTDPTSRDTDRDGLMDGEEDSNLNGRRDGSAVVETQTTPAEGDVSKSTAGTVLTTCAADDQGWTETDPNNPDSDGDEIIDGEERRVSNDDTELGKNESSPLMCDTDDDGVPDGMERRVGTFVNSCDSDEDGLADGIEMGIIHPESSNQNCRGLQASGTNMKRPSTLDPKNPDSDGDSLEDGVEDINQNGWVDESESDPSVSDTDGDSVEDGVEATGDFDSDGVPDFDMRLISNGRECNPPEAMGDLDCDGIPNVRDEDSDNDGCPDSLEGGWLDSNGNGIPDMYDADAIGCTSSSGGGGVPAVGAADGDEDDGGWDIPDWALDIGGGGDCSLNSDNVEGKNTHIAIMLILLGIMLMVRFMHVFSSRSIDKSLEIKTS